MKRMMLMFTLLAVGVLASAQEYPAKAITMIISFPPGGPTDVNARTFAQKLSELLGKPVVVENKAGAGGNIGAVAAARATPDGHTIYYNTSALVLSPSLYKNPGFDPIKDFTPVALTAQVPLVLVVNPHVPAKTVQELIAYAKANPDKMNYESAGAGTITHLAPALFLSQTGTRMQHVPYKGSAPGLAALASGDVQMGIDTLNTILPLVKDGRLRALAIAGARRHPSLPDVPTLSDALKMPGFEISAWQGVVVPAGTPASVVARLNVEINKAVNDPDVRARLAATGSEPLGGTGEQYAAYLKSEQARWAKVVKETGATLE